ncbi:DUF2238 domain-containing protein [Grimontia hollisae]
MTTSPINMLKVLTSLYALVFLFSAYNPNSYPVWIAEIVPAIGVLAIIWWANRYHHWSTTASILMFIWLCLHTIGAKYTFAEVPFDWFNDAIGSERNQFDRVAHFSIGLFAYPIAEVLLDKKLARPVIAFLFALFSIMAVAAGYEIIEWWYAELAGGDEGIAFLGSQGDIWDAQKDMLMDTLGGLASLCLLAYQRRYR